MTQLDDGHDYLHAKNKDKIFKQKQMREFSEAYVVIKSKPINKISITVFLNISDMKDIGVYLL